MDYYLSQRSCEGYVFTRICQSLCSQGGATPACIAGGIPACLATGGSAMGGCAPGGGPAPRGCLLQGCLLLEGACSRGDLLQGGSAPGGCLVQGVHAPGGLGCGDARRPPRYASYWNAFLLPFLLHLTKLNEGHSFFENTGLLLCTFFLCDSILSSFSSIQPDVKQLLVIDLKDQNRNNCHKLLCYQRCPIN